MLKVVLLNCLPAHVVRLLLLLLLLPIDCDRGGTRRAAVRIAACGGVGGVAVVVVVAEIVRGDRREATLHWVHSILFVKLSLQGDTSG